MMSISKRNIRILAAAAAIIVLIVIVTILIVLLVGRKSSEIFKRCDGSSEPIGEVTISSCPDCNRVGYCEIEANSTVHLEFNFTPEKNDESGGNYELTGPNAQLFGINYCNIATCPFVAGQENKAELTVNELFFRPNTSGQVKFRIFPLYGGDIYCVEFPFKAI